MDDGSRSLLHPCGTPQLAHLFSIQSFSTCYNRTLMAVDLRLCGTHFSTASELSLFVLASPTAKRRMLEPLAPIQEESFRK